MRYVKYPVEYKEWVTKTLREFKLRVKIGGLELTTNDIVSIRINSDLFSGDTFTIGDTVSDTLDMVIFTKAIFSHSDSVLDRTVPVIPYISLYTERFDEELGKIVVEWQEVNLGLFYINPDGIDKDGDGTTSIRASTMLNHPEYGGRIYKEDYNEETAPAFNRSITRIIDDICRDKKIPFTLAQGTVLPDITVTDANKGDFIGKTYREIIAKIAMLYGGYARVVVDRQGTGDTKEILEFFRLQDTDYVFGTDDYMSFKRGDHKLTIHKLSCKVSENSDTGKIKKITAGSAPVPELNTVYLENSVMTQEVLAQILPYYDGYGYFPITTKIFGNPLLEPGDKIQIKPPSRVPGNGDTINLPVQTVVYNITNKGITMDLKSLFTIVEEEKPKTLKKKVDKVSDDLNNLKNDVDNLKNGGNSYDDSELRNLINNKADKEHTHNYADSVKVNGNTYKQVNGLITLPDYPSSDALTSDIINAKRVNIFKDTIGNNYGVITSATALNESYKTLDIYGSQCLSLGVENATCMYMLIQNTKRTILDADLYTNGKTIHMEGDTLNIGNGDIYGNSSDYGTIANMELYYCRLSYDLNCNSYAIKNGKLQNMTGAQSTYSTRLANSGTNENMIYSNMSYDSGEIRWCWKETVFTYPESDVDPETDEWVDTGRYICYIELPIFMAENIQNDYHINISKMSWGDYRIIEKNPYYFILESKEDSFAFTFEVVAKLNDNQTLDNNAVIANDSVITENEETNQG